jgi:hypothetical protein
VRVGSGDATEIAAVPGAIAGQEKGHGLWACRRLLGEGQA